MKGLFFDYRRTTQEYWNSYFKEKWKCDEFWAVFVRLNKDKWFDYEEMYYDGNTAELLTIFGITFGKSYSYHAYRLEEK